MRLKKLNYDFEKQKSYEEKQKNVLNSVVSRINRISDFFDVVVKLEKFMIEEVREEYIQLVQVRQKKEDLMKSEGLEKYIKEYFLPAVERLNEKIEYSVQSWNHVERDYTTGKIYGFVSAMKNFYKELDKLNEEDDVNEFPMSELMKDVLDSFGNFKMFKAVMSEDSVSRIETLLEIQQDIVDVEEQKESNTKNKITLEDL